MVLLDAIDHRRILDALADGVVAADARQRVAYANAAAGRLLGWPAEELIGRPVMTIIPPRLRAAARAGFVRGFTEQRRANLLGRALRVPALRRDGSEIELDLLLSPPAPGGEAWTVATLRVPEAAGAAERIGLQKTQFLAAVSHDLRTPVNAITLQAELMGYLVAGAEPPVPAELRDLAADLRRAAGGLAELINDLLDLSRFDSGRIEHRPTDFAPEEWLAAALGPLGPTARAKGLTLSWLVDRPGRVLHADRVKLGRVLTNLVGNALKFTEAGAVGVSLGVDASGCLVLAVRDTGPGIPADQLGVIFDEFAQLRNPERDRSKGTGLGLAICRRLIESAGGHLAAESLPGLGSTFTATFPPNHLAHAIPEGPGWAPVAAPRQIPERPTILLVEDDERSRRPLTRLLERAGFAVEPARDGAEALEALGHRVPALVLLDLLLPGLDGPEFLRRLRADPAHAAIPVVVLSGDIDGERFDRALHLGVAGVLAKPVDFDSLKSLLSRLLPWPQSEVPARSPEPVTE